MSDLVNSGASVQTQVCLPPEHVPRLLCTIFIQNTLVVRGEEGGSVEWDSCEEGETITERIEDKHSLNLRTMLQSN